MARFEEFWTVACDYMAYMWMGIMVLIFLFVLDVISLLLVPPGTGSYYLALANTVMIVGLGVVLVGMYRACAKRQTKQF